jgi:hypothetical protein
MNFINGILILIGIILILIVVIIELHIFKPIIEKNVNLKELEIKNKRYELYSKLSTDMATDSIDNYITTECRKYITYNFVANKIDYINKDEVEIMTRELTATIVNDMSEVYLFYASIIRNIETDDDLISFIHHKVMEIVVAEVSNYNRPS